MAREIHETVPETIASSSKALAVGSNNFDQLKKDLTEVYENRSQLLKQLSKAKFNYYLTFLFSSKDKRESKKKVIADLKEKIASAYIELTFRKGMKDAGSWDESSFYLQELMQQCHKIWDLTSRQNTDQLRQRTIATESLERKLIGSRQQKTLDFIKSDVDCLYMPNLNGADLYIYPTFVVLFKSYKQFGIHDLSKVSVSLVAASFQEEQGVPKDSEVIGQTYKFTNKNGQPDKRYKNNYKIPIVRYGDMRLQSESGINDRYQFSNFNKFAEFAKSFTTYAQSNLGISVDK